MNKQTKSYLKNKLEELGIEPATRHGQNFLIDTNLQHMIVDSADLGPNDVVLEVGVGTAALSARIASQAGALVGIEIDRHLYELASEELFDFDNVTLLHMDALKNKNQFNEQLLEVVKEKLAERPGSQFKLVANLPYNIATPVLSNLLTREPLPCTMVATIQKELGDRIVAKPWTKDYGALSIWMQSQAETEIVRIMAPSVFWPSPKVDSAIVRIKLNRDLRNELPDPHYFHQFVRSMFFHRRKFLRANLLAAMKQHMNKKEVDAILAEMEFKYDVRSEQIDVSTFKRLCELVRQKAPDWKL